MNLEELGYFLYMDAMEKKQASPNLYDNENEEDNGDINDENE